jgi:phage shock protein PspC (stress-responsive transcriptional regulator)
MTISPPTGPPSGTPASDFSRRFRALHRLRRARRGRAFAGVAEGLSRHFDIDPIIVRVVFAALTFFGGAGLALYLILWLTVPMEDENESIMSGRLHRDSDSWLNIGLAAGGIVAATLLLSSIGWWLPHPFPVFVIAIIAVVAAVLFIRRGPDPQPVQAGMSQPPMPPPAGSGPWTDPQPTAPPVPTTPGNAVAATGTPGAVAGRPSDLPTAVIGDVTATAEIPADGATVITSPGAVAGDIDERAWWHRIDPPEADPAGSTGAATRVPKAPRSHLPLLSFAAMAIALAVLWVIDVETSANIDPSYYPGTVLALSAIGLLVSAFWGRARSLIAVGAIAAVATAGAVFAGPGPYGEQTLQPRQAAAVPASYRWGIGDLTLNLAQVNDAFDLQGRTVTLKEHLGRVTVIIPTSVAAIVHASVDHGSIDGPRGVLHGDNGAEHAVMTPPPLGRPTMHIDVHVDDGEIRILRVDCPNGFAGLAGEPTDSYLGGPRVAAACN